MGNNNKGQMILLIIIATATLVVAVAGATFAYFGISMENGKGDTTIEVTSGTISVEYQDNSVIKAGALNPNDSVASKTFTVNGLITGSSNLNYEANLVINNNTYGDGELVYTITSTNDNNNGTIITSTTEPVAIPTGANTIVLGKGSFAGPITTGATHTYTVNIYVNGTATFDPNKAVDAKISVTQAVK